MSKSFNIILTPQKRLFIEFGFLEEFWCSNSMAMDQLLKTTTFFGRARSSHAKLPTLALLLLLFRSWSLEVPRVAIREMALIGTSRWRNATKISWTMLKKVSWNEDVIRHCHGTSVRTTPFVDHFPTENEVFFLLLLESLWCELKLDPVLRFEGHRRRRP